jgi:MtrB/PioB family decaheme-associated outer membrane protein
MNTPCRPSLPRLALLGLALTSHAGLAAADDSPSSGDPFAALGGETRPLATRWQTDYRGSVQLGAAWTSDDNFMFGQYNGLADEGGSVLGALRWSDYRNPDSHWDLRLDDLGLATREGQLTWGSQRLQVTLELDSQRQVRNDSGATPFRGETRLQLPVDWQSGLRTGDFTTFDDSRRGLNRELDRDRYRLGLESQLNDAWSLYGSWLYEEKEGTGDIGAGIYIDAASADAALLPLPVDYTSQEGELGLRFDGERLHLDGSVQLSEFDNANRLLSWQNPYSSYSPTVRYPDGYGALLLPPDNQQWSGRLSANWLLRPDLRLTLDASYALAEQDDLLPEYSVNPALTLRDPLPRARLDGEVATGIVNGKLWWRPLAALEIEGWYRGRERDYDVPRDRYLYVRGDGASQPRDELAVYNTAHDLVSRTVGGEARYRLGKRQRLSLEYEYEEIERRNAAVEKTEESRLTLGYRLRLASALQARLALDLADRAASTYHWEQSYYALLDTGLINLTPDSQRYLNHPQFSQYYLANREQLGLRADFSYQSDPRWQLNLNLQAHNDDYDQSELGLKNGRWYRAQLSASYTPVETVSATVYGGLDRYTADQVGRAFRGGQEKNAFVLAPPLPQASDPARNWTLAAEDNSFNLGGSLHWQLQPRVELQLDYSYVDTSAGQDLAGKGAADLDVADLPDVDTRLHQLGLEGQWHLRDSLSLVLDYRFYRYETDDWSWRQVGATTLDKVLGFGERNPNESIHYMGLSVIYRWQ